LKSAKNQIQVLPNSFL